MNYTNKANIKDYNKETVSIENIFKKNHIHLVHPE